MGTIENNGYKVTEVHKGILYVKKDSLFPIQIIITGRLSRKHQKWLTLLQDELNLEDMRRAVAQANELTLKADKDYADAVLQLVIKENENIFHEFKEEDIMCQALRDLFADELKAAVDTAVEENQELI